MPLLSSPYLKQYKPHKILPKTPNITQTPTNQPSTPYPIPQTQSQDFPIPSSPHSPTLIHLYNLPTSYHCLLEKESAHFWLFNHEVQRTYTTYPFVARQIIDSLLVSQSLSLPVSQQTQFQSFNIISREPSPPASKRPFKKPKRKKISLSLTTWAVKAEGSSLVTW